MTKQNKLVLPTNYKSEIGWNYTLLRMLAASGVFTIRTKEFKQIPTTRYKNWTLMEVNDRLVALDTWDTLGPTDLYYKAGLFKSEFKNLDLLIKIQWHNNKYWADFTKDTDIPVTAWTVMPNKEFPLMSFQYSADMKHKHIGIVSGRNNRFGRQGWVDWCVKNSDFVTDNSYVVNDNMSSYVHNLSGCKWGIILRGRVGAEKNRRESEFTSCGMPLAMNYDPQYPFNMIAGKHYYRLHKPADLANLRHIDPRPFALESIRLWKDHFSPLGMSVTLIKLVNSLCS